MGAHKRQIISWLAERLLDSQEPFYMECNKYATPTLVTNELNKVIHCYIVFKNFVKLRHFVLTICSDVIVKAIPVTGHGGPIGL
jgi:hypothetical protein